MIFNTTPKDQFRLMAQLRNDFFQIPYVLDPNSSENQQFDSSGLRDSQHESDAIVAFSWLAPLTLYSLQVSPFYPLQQADYESNPNDTPVATTADRSSTYGGAQAPITSAIARNTIQAGLYSFGQHDNYLFGAMFNDDSGNANFSIPDSANGGVIEEYIIRQLQSHSVADAHCRTAADKLPERDHRERNRAPLRCGFPRPQA